MIITLKAFVIRYTLKNLRCGLLNSFDIISDVEEGDIFFQLAVLSKIKKKNEREIEYWVPEFFSKREEKGALNNLTRNETSRKGTFFR